MMAIGSDDESECGWSSLHTAGGSAQTLRGLSAYIAAHRPTIVLFENVDSVPVEVVDSVPVEVSELSPLASSSHMYPIVLERVAQQGIDFRAKRVAFDVLKGLRPMRLRVWASRWRWLSWNGHLVFALMRVWASLTWSLRRPKKITVVV